MSTLNHIIQTVMGWTNSHLHLFEANGISYQMPDPDFPFENDQRNERGVRVDQVLPSVGARGIYVYDFGDHWVHEVVVEEIGPSPFDELLPVCLQGAGACPPEDCGGTSGYAQMLEAISNPGHEEYIEYLHWVGGPFDPAGFDLNGVNRKLLRFR